MWASRPIPWCAASGCSSARIGYTTSRRYTAEMCRSYCSAARWDQHLWSDKAPPFTMLPVAQMSPPGGGHWVPCARQCKYSPNRPIMAGTAPGSVCSAVRKQSSGLCGVDTEHLTRRVFCQVFFWREFMDICVSSSRAKPTICARRSLCQDTPVGTLGIQRRRCLREIILLTEAGSFVIFV
jgi:hypothetical protein